MNIREMEDAIIRQAATDLIEAGLQVSVWNGEGYEIERSTDPDAIVAATHATDEERIYVHRPLEVRACGWVDLVYGNDGHDVISDNTVSLEGHLASAHALADEFANSEAA